MIKLITSLGYAGENKISVTGAEWEQGEYYDISSERQTGGRSGRFYRPLVGPSKCALRSLAAGPFFVDSPNCCPSISTTVFVWKPCSMTETVGIPFASILVGCAVSLMENFCSRTSHQSSQSFLRTVLKSET